MKNFELYIYFLVFLFFATLISFPDHLPIGIKYFFEFELMLFVCLVISGYFACKIAKFSTISMLLVSLGIFIGGKSFILDAWMLSTWAIFGFAP